MATKAFSDQSLSLHLPLSSHLVLSLPLCEFECFATACRSEAHPACFVSCRSLFFFLMLAFQMSQTISSEAPDAVFLALQTLGFIAAR